MILFSFLLLFGCIFACDLPCWLSNLNVSIPPIPITKDDFNLTFSATCKGLTITSIDSKILNNDTIQIAINGIATSCHGNWSALQLTFHDTWDGQIDIDIHDTDFSTQITIKSGETYLPWSSSLSQCDATLVIQSVHFIGSSFADKIANLFEPLIQPALEKFIDNEICSELTTLVGTNVTEEIQYLNQFLYPYAFGPKIFNLPFPGEGIIDLQTFPIITLADFFLDSVMGIDGPMNINLDINTVFTNGDFVLYDLPPFGFPISTLGMVNLTIDTLEIVGLNTFDDFDLLVPQSPTQLLTLVKLEKLSTNISVQLVVTTENTTVQDQPLLEHFNLTFSLTNVEFKISNQLAIKEQLFNSFHYNQFENYTCVLSAIESLNFSELYVQSDIHSLALIPKNAQTIDKQLDNLIDNVISLFLINNKLLNPLFNTVLGDMVRPMMQDFVHDYATGCPAPKSVEIVGPLKKSVIAPILTSSFGIAGAVGYFIWVGRSQPNKRKNPYSQKSGQLSENGEFHKFDESSTSIKYQPEHQPPNLEDYEQPEIIVYSSIDQDTVPDDSPLLHPLPEKNNQKRSFDFLSGSLATESSIPKWVALLVPVLLIGTGGLFLISNLSPGASVLVQITVGNSKITLPPVFEFSLKNSIQDMWNAGLYPLSILIAFFSGFWPYFKLFLMLISWIVPPRLLSSHHRETLLMVLDYLGKWSLLDTMVMVLMQVAFYLHMADPKAPGTALDIIVSPDWGFHLFLISTLLSLVYSHALLALHRGCKSPESLDSPSTQKAATSIQDSSIKKNPNKHNEQKISLFVLQKRQYAIAIVVFILFSFCAVGAGIYEISFEFYFGGAAGLVLEFTGQPVHTRYSVLSIAENLPKGNPDPEGLGIRWIQAVFYLVAVITPLVHFVFLFVLWVIPMSLKHQRLVFHITEVLNAWSTLDVFVLAIIAALVEIRQFAIFVMGPRCNMINPLLKKYFNAPLDGDDVCFDVESKLLDGCWILFAACLFDIVATNFVIKVCRDTLSQREKLSQLETDNSFGSTTIVTFNPEEE